MAQRPRQALAALALLGGLASAGASGAAVKGEFESCLPAGEVAPTYLQLQCLYRAGARSGNLAETRRRLELLGGGTLEHPWPTLVLAAASREISAARALELYRLAAEGFARSGEAEGEVIARHNLRNGLYDHGEPEAASRQVELALAAARASGDRMALARASVLAAEHQSALGHRLGEAREALLAARELAFPAGPIGLRRTILLSLANLSLELGRYDEAIEALEQHQRLRQEDGLAIDAATVAFNLLNARITREEESPRPGARPELVAAAEATLAEVQELGATTTEARTHGMLGHLLATSDPELAARHLARCLALEAGFHHPEERVLCLGWLAGIEAAKGRERAERLSREALALATSTGDDLLVAYAWQARLRLVWRVLPPAAALAESRSALASIERLRLWQPDAAARAGLFAGRARDYAFLAGKLLGAQPPELGTGFEVGERQRARVLLESLVRADIEPRPEAEKTGPEAAPFASLEAVRAALAPEEALLWFELGAKEDVYGEPGGGSWLLAVDRGGARLYPLPDARELATAASALAGLARQREASPGLLAEVARRLGERLLAPALAGLPASVQRLVIAADGALHRLPFELLGGPGGVPLAARYQLTVVPSATLWLALHRRTPTLRPRSVLILADPASPLRTGEELAALPWARKEARSIARLVPAGPRVLLAEDASEERLKAGAAREFAALHLAVHAVADEAFPERSTIFLAPGSALQDGRLTPAEIAGLDLSGRLVVLAACDSAEGELLSGEGILSLARAFFEAGAQTVVASRWPLRDDDAAFLFERFYRALGQGGTAAAALTLARREAIEAGLPPAAWAGLVLLGEGGSRLPAPGPWKGRLPLLGLGVLVAMLGIWFRRGRSRSSGR
ncbi:MAG: CHAT domain-containing protein [Thermoanaerobaculia bacterium]